MTTIKEFREFFYKDKIYGNVIKFEIKEDKKYLTIRFSDRSEKGFFDYTFIEYNNSPISFDDDLEPNDRVRLILLADWIGRIDKIKKRWVDALLDFLKEDLEKNGS